MKAGSYVISRTVAHLDLPEVGGLMVSFSIGTSGSAGAVVRDRERVFGTACPRESRGLGILHRCSSIMSPGRVRHPKTTSHETGRKLGARWIFLGAGADQPVGVRTPACLGPPSHGSISVKIPAPPACTAATPTAGRGQPPWTPQASRPVARPWITPRMANLRELSDVIGPRLSGSAATRRANDWTAERFRSYGLRATPRPTPSA
jgi:hypothetical protein